MPNRQGGWNMQSSGRMSCTLLKSTTEREEIVPGTTRNLLQHGIQTKLQEKEGRKENIWKEDIF